MLQLVRAKFEEHVPEIAGLPVIGMSALTGDGAAELMPAVIDLLDRWQRRVSTARLNRWLEKVISWGGALPRMSAAARRFWRLHASKHHLGIRCPYSCR